MSTTKKPPVPVPSKTVTNETKTAATGSTTLARTPVAAVPAPTPPPKTIEPSMRDRVLAAFSTSPTKSLRWWELVHLCGDKAKGDQTIQLDALGARDHNIKVWYGVSKEFHDAIQALREEQRIRLFGVSPVGYFPAAMMPPLPLAPDYKIAYHKPHLFLTNVELVSG